MQATFELGNSERHAIFLLDNTEMQPIFELGNRAVFR